MVAEMFACPHCRSSLAAGEDRLDCRACGRSYPTDGEVFRFAMGESTHGEFSRAEMAEFLALAREKGWRQALETYAGPRRPRAVQLVTDPRRYRSIESLKAAGGGRVLDFGCGYGGVSLELAKMFDEVVSLDGSQERVSLLSIVTQQDKIENIVPVCHIDAARLPFPDNHFDAVVLIGVFEYLPAGFPGDSPAEAHQKCLKEFRRILRPGGHLMIQSKNRFGWQYWLGERDHSGLRFAPVLPVPVTDMISRKLKGRPYRIINYSMGGYRRILQQAGLADIRFAWPVPGYQAPDYVLSLEEDMPLELRKIRRGYHSPFKTLALRALALAGILKRFVPHYSITAVKPRNPT